MFRSHWSRLVSAKLVVVAASIILVTPTQSAAQSVPRGLTQPASGEEAAPQPAGRDYALLFATNVYDDPGLTGLSNPIADATAIARELREEFGFAETEIVANPTKKEILDKLFEYAGRTFAGSDQLFLFFAGHGTYVERLDLGHIVTRDSQALDPGGSSYLSYADLAHRIGRIPIRRVFLVLDVCFGGTFGGVATRGDSAAALYGSASLTERQRRLRRDPVKKYLTSGSKEYVPDGTPGAHSPFAWRFLEALRTKGEGGLLTALEVVQHVRTVAASTPVWGDLPGSAPGSDFVFVRRSASTVSEASPPASAPPTVPTSSTNAGTGVDVLRPDTGRNSAWCDAPPSDAPRRGVCDTLAKYKAAYEARDVNAVREVFPNQLESVLRRSFSGLISLTVNMRCGEIALEGSRATVACQIQNVAKYQRSGAPPPPSILYEVSLRRQGKGWEIVSLTQQ